MQIVSLSVAKLRRRHDARSLDERALSGLTASIREVGILNPIRVRPITITEYGQPAEGYEVTAGRHRFEVAYRTNMETVPCIVENDNDLRAELIMLDENLMRAELSPADRARGTARRKEIYEVAPP